MQPKQITLNGMLKSGVGRLTSNVSEYTRTKPSDDDDDERLDRGLRSENEETRILSFLPLIQRERGERSKNVVRFRGGRKESRYHGTRNVESMVGIRWEFVPFQERHLEFETDHNGSIGSNQQFQLIRPFTIFARHIRQMD